MTNADRGPRFESPVAPWPHFDDELVETAASVLRSGRVNYWTGEEGRAFEREYAAFCGRKHAIAVANGTVALELALLAFGIGSGDEVLVTSRTFVASASAVVMRGARPVVVDVDRSSGNVTTDTLRARLTDRTRAIVCVHLAGWPCDMEPIMELARERDLVVIEDCAQAHGAEYRGQPVGGMGHVSAFSFCQDKIMTTGGEGGMVLMDDRDAWARAWAFKDHGKDYDTVYRREHPPGFRWLHQSFGTNWRLTEMQSALGRALLKRLPGEHAIRTRNAAVYRDALAPLAALRVPSPPGDVRHAWYKFYAYVQADRLRPDWSRDRIRDEIAARGVPCFTGSCSEIYLEQAFGSDLRPAERFPVARELGETSLMFLVHPTLTEEDVRAMADVARWVVEQATA